MMITPSSPVIGYSDAPNHRGSALVADLFLREWLHLPPGSSIVDVSYDPKTALIEVIIEHPNIPPQPQGSQTTRLEPIFTTDYDTGTVTADWGFSE